MNRLPRPTPSRLIETRTEGAVVRLIDQDSGGCPAVAVAGALLSGPGQLCDRSSIVPIITLEDYGFCRNGDGGKWVEGGRIELGGELPINTSGGLLSETGMPGLQLVLEGVRQLRGSSVNQVRGARKLAVSNQGAIMHTHSTLVLGT